MKVHKIKLANDNKKTIFKQYNILPSPLQSNQAPLITDPPLTSFTTLLKKEEEKKKEKTPDT